jgi:hypothetical protein
VGPPQQPPTTWTQVSPPVNFDFGEVAINAILKAQFLDEINTMNSGPLVKIYVDVVEFDFEKNQIGFSLQLRVTYDNIVVVIPYNTTLAASKISFTFAPDKIIASLVDYAAFIDAQYASLPDWVKLPIKNTFVQLKIWEGNLLSDLGDHFPDGGRRIIDALPIKWDASFSSVISIEDDFLRIAIAPKLEVGGPAISVEYEHVGCNGYFYMTFKSNCKMSVTDFTLETISGYTLVMSGDPPPKAFDLVSSNNGCWSKKYTFKITDSNGKSIACATNHYVKCFFKSLYLTYYVRGYMSNYDGPNKSLGSLTIN